MVGAFAVTEMYSALWLLDAAAAHYESRPWLAASHGLTNDRAFVVASVQEESRSERSEKWRPGRSYAHSVY